jgi:hypothetical protein
MISSSKARIALTILLSGWSLAATARPILLTVDIADLSNTTIASTGAAAENSGSGLSATLDGISLLGIFSAPTNNTRILFGDLKASSASSAYTDAWTLPDDIDLNLFNFSFDAQIFDTSSAAFSGASTIDFTGYSLLAAGSVGDIIDSDGFFVQGVVIGQWQIIDSSASVPEPGALSLLGLGLLGLALNRRRSSLTQPV